MKSHSLVALAAITVASGCADERDLVHGEEAATATARQALPAEPVPGSDFAAERAFVGDPLLGMGAGEAGSVYTLASDDPAGMASTTKSFTVLLAVEAVEKGHVSMDDWVVISAKAAGINNGHTGGGHSNAGLVEGDSVRFRDLLYAVILPSAGDASIAVAQHVAVSTYPYLASESDAQQEAAFVDMMNDRAAELGLADTVFQNPYGGDHFHSNDNTPGGPALHQASTRDMARWFHYGMQKPLYREILGFQGTHVFASLEGNLFIYTRSFGYPGMTGSKGGSNAECLTCGLSQVRRIGRDLVMAYTQGAPGDGTTLYDYGFAKLFTPLPRAESPTFSGGWKQTSLACVTSSRAASAVVRPNGELRVLLWGLDLDSRSPSIEHLNDQLTVFTPPGGYVIDRGGPGEPPRRPPGFAVRPTTPEPPTTLGYAGPPPDTGLPPAAGTIVSGSGPLVFQESRIQYAENGNLVVAASTNTGVRLLSYGITGSDTVVQRDMELVGAGSDPRVVVLNANLVVTSHRDAAGDLVLRSFRLDPVTGKLSNALDTRWIGASQAGEVEIAGRPGLAAGYHLVVAYLNGGSDRVVRAYEVAHQTGEISAESSVFPSGSSSSLALTRVPGYGTDRDVYALAFRNGAGRLVLEAYEYSPQGSLSRQGVRTDVGPNLLGGQARIQLSPYREAGVFVTVQADPSIAVQRLEAWSLDASATSTSITPNRVTSEIITESGLGGSCRVPNTSAEGDFLVSTGALPLDGIKLRAFRSAPR